MDAHTQAHPQLAAVAALLRDNDLAPADPLSDPLPVAREAARRYNALWNRALPPVARVTEMRVPVPGGEVMVRIYRPVLSAAPPPVLVYFHGGGFVLNGLDSHDRLMRLLALRSGAAVAGVSYSLAPETRFPGQLEQALAVIAWLRTYGAALGLEPTRLAVGGDSAGANLALAATLALRDRALALPAFGLLLYGMFSADLATASHRAFGGGAHGLTTERVDWFWSQYLADPAQRSHPLAAPLGADLHGLPPQAIIGAGLDCLLDDSVRLASRLGEAGVEASLSIHRGVPHSFMLMSEVLEPADRAVTEAATAVNRALFGAALYSPVKTGLRLPRKAAMPSR